jgi:hypothetical protein
MPIRVIDMGKERRNGDRRKGPRDRRTTERRQSGPLMTLLLDLVVRVRGRDKDGGRDGVLERRSD